MSALDPRLNAYRPDLADAALKGQVAAARYVEGRVMTVKSSRAPLTFTPRTDAAMESELLTGEPVRVFETTDEGWCWGQASRDGYVGWLPAGALAADPPAATHRVEALSTFAFPAPDLKRRPRGALFFGARVAVTGEATGSGAIFALIASVDGELAVPARHLAPIGAPRPSDFVTVAERFVGVPYLWGGRTSRGIDCSGLLQVALEACAIRCPRDTDLQQAGLGGKPVSAIAELIRGDLVFWPGHVGLMQDEVHMLHANAHHMAVASEPLDKALARFGRIGLEISSMTRIAPDFSHMVTATL